MSLKIEIYFRLHRGHIFIQNEEFSEHHYNLSDLYISNTSEIVCSESMLLNFNFDALGTSKHGKGKSLWKKLFCCTYQYIGEI